MIGIPLFSYIHEDMMQTKNFNDYLSGERILQELIRFRIQEAIKRHPAQRLAAISPQAQDPIKVVPPDFTNLFPPRRQWKQRPKRKQRQHARQQNILRRQLELTVRAAMRSEDQPNAPWHLALETIIRQIQERSNMTNPQFDPPEAFLVRKDTGGTRTLHAFRNPVQRVLLALLTHYLSDQIDSALSPCSYAFRKDATLNRTKAVEKLNEYRAMHRDVYVAECDLHDFFDHVPHTAIRQSLAPFHLDPQALRLLDAYLEAGATSQGTGIPQGGAPSPILANLVLTPVDAAVHNPAPYVQLCQLDAAPSAVDNAHITPVFYARFCDDILIAHPDPEVCLSGFASILAAIRAQGLQYHPPVQVASYGPAFYEIKSKYPYRWADPGQHENAVPWVPFLGYQIRHDGRLRVRTKSMRKQLDKINDDIESVRLLVQRTQPEKLRVGGDTILSRTASHLVSMSVGRISRSGSGPMQPCWRDAFTLLDVNPSASLQCKQLDHNRERQLRRLKRAFIQQGILNPPPDPPPPNLESATQKPKPFYLGAPFSYHAALRHENNLPSNNYEA